MAFCKDRTGPSDLTRVQNFRTFTLFFCFFHFVLFSLMTLPPFSLPLHCSVPVLQPYFFHIFLEEPKVCVRIIEPDDEQGHERSFVNDLDL